MLTLTYAFRRLTRAAEPSSPWLAPARPKDLEGYGCYSLYWRAVLEEENLEKLFDMLYREFKDDIVIAYEPVWANGTVKWRHLKAGSGRSMQLLSSVNGEHSSDLAKKEDIDGFLVGGASLKLTDSIELDNSNLLSVCHCIIIKGPEFATIINSVTSKKVAA
ncbi:hypothetical protein HAX54_002986 [Datura stramonium]|uniref:Triosephosphate isomerase n=1 Tax=Datura stramonium TaxID=4076 RepID=A0ABS8T4P8_DATST|nr:hypothetical protein [Datura stramonium]